MKIAICGSMTASKKMVEIEKELIKQDHEVILPKFTKEYSKLKSAESMHSESVRNKVGYDLIRTFFDEIKSCDAVLILNEKRHNIDNYIGGNTFLEIGFAHVLDKKIFLLNDIPDMIYSDEIKAMKPVILDRDLNKITTYEVL